MHHPLLLRHLLVPQRSCHPDIRHVRFRLLEGTAFTACFVIRLDDLRVYMAPETTAV